MATREGALSRAAAFFDGGGFKSLLSDLVAIPSTAQEEGREGTSTATSTAPPPLAERLGFAVQCGPIPRRLRPHSHGLRIEDESRPTVLLYGHGDTVRGLEDQWRQGLEPWKLIEEGDRWYGRGTADNKGHTRSTSPPSKPCWRSAAAGSAAT